MTTFEKRVIAHASRFALRGMEKLDADAVVRAIELAYEAGKMVGEVQRPKYKPYFGDTFMFPG